MNSWKKKLLLTIKDLHVEAFFHFSEWAQYYVTRDSGEQGPVDEEYVFYHHAESNLFFVCV